MSAPENGRSRPRDLPGAAAALFNTHPQDTPLDAARWAAAQGGRVHPLKPGEKVPATRNGALDASSDPAQLEAWAAQFPGCNWGLANGALFDVIDLDGDTGLASALEHFGGTLPPVMGWAQSPNGLHGYIPATGRRRKLGALPKVDLLGDGGYTVLVGSVLADGRRYQWVQPPVPGHTIDPAPWLELWDAAGTTTGPASRGTVPGAVTVPTDPERAKAYAEATLAGLRRDLEAAEEWDEGDTDARGRGWEKLVADAALTVARLARTPGSGVTEADGLDVLLELVPDSIALDVPPAEKWRTQGKRAEPYILPPRGPEALGLSLPEPPQPQEGVQGAVVDRRRVVGALHAQAQFADGLAASVSARHMHVHGLGWRYFDGKRWREDAGDARVLRALRGLLEHTAASNIENSDVLKAVRATSSATAMEGVLRIARASAELGRDVEDLDADPYALNVANGTLDLRTLELRPHDPADNITRVARAAWTPGNDWRTTRWGTFLAEVLPETEVRAYLQRYVGLALVGEVIEHKLLVLTGTGRNGKGVFYGAVSHALGDYAVSAEPDLFMHREGAHPTGTMDLLGARWVTVSESDSGRRLADATVKRLTGGDAIRARRMGKDFVQFEPSHTAAMVTNHLPRVSAEDQALWARLRVVPFGVVVPDAEQDTALPAKLRAEADAVLAWAVEGLADYYARGMAEPAAVKVATSAYRDDNDALAEFLEERTEHTGGTGVLVSELHTAWVAWCRERRLEAEGRKAFTDTLQRRGLTKVNTNRGVAWRGLALRQSGFFNSTEGGYNPMSEPSGGVCGVSPAPPDIPSYAGATLETPQTPLDPPLEAFAAAGIPRDQAAILARITKAGADA